MHSSYVLLRMEGDLLRPLRVVRDAVDEHPHRRRRVGRAQQPLRLVDFEPTRSF